MDADAVNKKIDKLAEILEEKPEQYKRLFDDRDALLAEHDFEPELISSFKINKVDDVTAKGGCKCSSWCGFGCFYGPQIGAEGESCVG